MIAIVCVERAWKYVWSSRQRYGTSIYVRLIQHSEGTLTQYKIYHSIINSVTQLMPYIPCQHWNRTEAFVIVTWHVIILSDTTSLTLYLWLFLNIFWYNSIRSRVSLIQAFFLILLHPLCRIRSFPLFPAYNNYRNKILYVCFSFCVYLHVTRVILYILVQIACWFCSGQLSAEFYSKSHSLLYSPLLPFYII